MTTRCVEVREVLGETSEANDVISSSWPDSASQGQLLGRAITKVDNDTVEENSVAYA